MIGNLQIHPIETDAKNRLKALSKDEYEEFAEKLKAKDAKLLST